SYGSAIEAPPDERGGPRLCPTYRHRVTSRLYRGRVKTRQRCERTNVGRSDRAVGDSFAMRRGRATPQFEIDPRFHTGSVGSRRSLNSSRKTEFGASGHCGISTSDVSKIAADRPLSKMRQCANDLFC